jgi:hypothetical protein
MTWGALVVLLGVAAAEADAARLKTDATLHARPSASSDVVGQVAAGTRVEVMSESNGWREIKAPAGKGFVRTDQLVLGEAGERTAKPAEKKADDKQPDENKAEAKKADQKKADEKKPEKPATARAEPVPDVPKVSPEELRQLVDDVRMLRERPEPATAVDLQRVEQTLTQAITVLGEKAAAPAEPTLPDTSLESMLALSPVLLLVGGLVGFVVSRVTQRRRDNRNRIRV